MQTGIVKNIKPSKKSIWIKRKGENDLFGTADNADPSIKDTDGCFTLNVGDTVHFDEGIDSQNHPTALQISLSTIGNTMSGKQTQNNQNQNNPKQSSAPRVFVDFPRDGQTLVESTKKGHYNIRLRVGHNAQDQSFEIPVRLYLINGDERWCVKSFDIKDPQVILIEDEKLDLNQSLYAEVEKLGYSGSKEGKDKIEISTRSVKKASAPATPLQRITSKFVAFSAGDSPNSIQIFKKDGDGKFCGGLIQVTLGQAGKVNGTDAINGSVDIPVSATGVIALAITLDERHAVVIITDMDSGETTKEYLKKS